ncbi:hypothetical protein Taro_002311, partial [Colocasia esculenta]|nr:hypothetical protein [Colocasia esculenta]
GPPPASLLIGATNKSLLSITEKRKKQRIPLLWTLPVVGLPFLRSSAACAMSSAVCESGLPSTGFILDGLRGGAARCGDVAASAVEAAAIDQWLAQQEAAIQREAAEKKDGQIDIWASIQSSKKAAEPGAPYVHPLVRRSASSLSQKSLEICTESLGSETGSDGVLSSDELGEYLPWPASDEEEVAEEKEETEQEHHEAEDAERVLPPPPPLPPPHRRKELAAVNYHCSISKRSPPRAFPPPLPSLSRRDGPCLSMRPHRRDGRLVVEAVSVPSQNYLHARRQDGRLLLSLVETTFQEVYPEREEPAMHRLQQQQPQADADGPVADEEDRRWSEDLAADDAAAAADADVDEEEVEEEEEDEEEEEEEGEEEVEVVDRGIVVEVNVSRPPQPQSGGMKVQRSSVVINKFVGAAAVEGKLAGAPAAPPRPAPSNATATTTTTATAVVAAAAAASSSLSTDERYWRYGTGPQSAQRHPSPEKLFFTSKRQMNRQDLLHQVRRCSEHLRPLFIWEPCCIATS